MSGIVEQRIDAVRDFCKDQLTWDAIKTSGNGSAKGGLTDRAWCAQSVLNILDGNIDDQLRSDR